MTPVVLTALALLAGPVVAQDSPTAAASTPASTAGNTQPAAANPLAPQMSYSVSEVLQLSQAKVADNVIVSYVQNSGKNYSLDANQIIYLRQQGVSDTVINTMLNQHPPSVPTVSTAPTEAPESPTASSTPTSSTTAASASAQPAVAYVPATTASTVYVIPDSQTYYYNNWLYSRPYYGYYPAYYPYYYGGPTIALSFGFGFGSYYGGGYHSHGGYNGGWHNNGWHGGGGSWHH